MKRTVSIAVGRLKGDEDIRCIGITPTLDAPKQSIVQSVGPTILSSFQKTETPDGNYSEAAVDVSTMSRTPEEGDARIIDAARRLAVAFTRAGYPVALDLTVHEVSGVEQNLRVDPKSELEIVLPEAGIAA